MENVSGIGQILTQLKATSDLATDINKLDSTDFDASRADFGQLLKSAVEQVNTAQQTANRLNQEFVRGNQDVELHEVMISLQKANISFQSMIQVRNRLVMAYQEIMNMQV